MTAAIVLTACGSSTSTNITPPSALPERCQPNVQGSQTSFNAAGGTGTLTIGVPRECGWSVTSLAPWVEITSAREGQGEGSVSFRVLQNADPVVRRGGLGVGDARVDITQEAAPCRFDVALSSGSIGADGGQTRVDVAAHSACRWTAASQAPFATVSPSSGTGTAAVQVVFQSNPGSARTATLVVAGQSLSITQSARNAPPPAPPPAPGPPPPATCSFDVSPASASFGATGGTGGFTVTASAPTCSWTASRSENWISLSNASGTGSGQVQYLVQQNNDGQSRDANITVSGRTHRVTQAGADDDDDDDEVKVRGVVTGLSGSCPALQFTLGGTLVRTTDNTEFKGGKCQSVANEREVDVEGRLQNGILVARKVELRK